MADSKTSGLTELTATAAADFFPVVDDSDTTMAATGTNKWITAANLLGHSGTPLVATGTWTPVLRGSSVAGSNTYSTQSGFYTRIANRCFIDCTLDISSVDGSMAGNLELAGLPIAANGNTLGGGAGALEDIDFGDGLNFFAANSSSHLSLRKNNSGTTGAFANLTPSDLGSTPKLRLTFAYKV